MDDYQSLKHTKWECKYHVVFIPKCRRKILYGKLRRHLGGIFKELASQKECQIEEGHLKVDHVHMLISVPPKYAVAQVVGYLKGKSAIHIARTFARRQRNFVGENFWAREDWVVVSFQTAAEHELIEERPVTDGTEAVRQRRYAEES
jgi:REP-associated tyrosine transposase